MICPDLSHQLWGVCQLALLGKVRSAASGSGAALASWLRNSTCSTGGGLQHRVRVSVSSGTSNSLYSCHTGRCHEDLLTLAQVSLLGLLTFTVCWPSVLLNLLHDHSQVSCRVMNSAKYCCFKAFVAAALGFTIMFCTKYCCMPFGILFCSRIGRIWPLSKHWPCMLMAGFSQAPPDP